jgi:PAS domain S-box-containing protein
MVSVRLNLANRAPGLGPSFEPVSGDFRLREASAPTREKLERHDAACLLWDGDRLRIAWANTEALRLFGADTLFDLLDRRFHAEEPGPDLLRRLKTELRGNETRLARVEFPGVETEVELDAACSLHPLTDGRQGVLLIGRARRSSAAEASVLAEVFLQLPIAAAVIDKDGKVIHQNAAAQEFFPAERSGSLTRLFDTEAAANTFLSRAHKAGVMSTICRFATSLGPREARLIARRMGESAKDPHRLIVTIEDVTERRALERMLAGASSVPSPPAQQSPEKSATEPTASEKIPAVIIDRLEAQEAALVILRDTVMLYANGRALRLLGAGSLHALKQRSDLVTTLVSTADSLTLTDDAGNQEVIDIARSPVPWNKGWASQATLRSRAVEQNTAAAPERAGRKIASREISPAPAASAAVISKMAEDISWKPDDSELSAILDTASDGIVTLDAEGRIRSFSAGAEAIFGQPKALVLGRSFAELLTADTSKVFRDYLAALTDSGLAAVFNDGREVSANVGPGRSLPLFLTISRIHDDRRGVRVPPAFCAVVRDITQWKQTEAELRDAKDKAEQTSRQKSEFLARISHELRTPLNAILGFSELMRLERFGKLQNEKYRGYVSDIHSSGVHLLSLINDLLDLSKVEAGKLELTFISVSLPEVTDHAVRLLAERAQQARVSVRRNFPADLPNVVADLRSMRQIMINLLSNAIKFTDPGGHVTIAGRLNKAGELVLRVRDTGVGMNQEEIKSALEPFQRVTTAARPDMEGTGLGLPLTKALTEANRATFAISSEPGKGTLVEITYPTTRVLAD